MKTSSPFGPPRAMEAPSGALSLVFGAMVVFLTLVSLVLWSIGRAAGELVVAGALFGSALVALGLWIWRRSKVKGARPIDARLYFFLVIAFPLLRALLEVAGAPSYSGGRIWLSIGFLLLFTPIGIWFFVRYVLPEARG